MFNQDRYFDVFVEYAKDGPDDLLVQVTVVNRGPTKPELHLLPTLWFCNDWSSWIAGHGEKPILKQIKGSPGTSTEAAQHPILGTYYLYCEGNVPLLFTENETNNERLFPEYPNMSPYVKDGINSYVVQGQRAAVNQPHPPVNQGCGALPAGRGCRPIDDGLPAPHQPGPSRAG